MGSEMCIRDSCLAVSPSLKRYGIPGRARLFEVVQRIREVNLERKRHAPSGNFHGASSNAEELAADPGLEVSYITAVPRMSYYMNYSTQIYDIYLKYVAPEDVHVYSVDEVFIDATAYLKTYQMSARDLALRMMMNKGAQLVADDRTDVEEKFGRLRATCPENIRGMMEVRGIGLCRFEPCPSVFVELAVELVPAGEKIERLPEAETAEFLSLIHI